MGKHNLDSLDPRTKIAVVFSISGASFFIRTYSGMLALLIFTLLFLVLSGVSIPRQRKQVKGFLGMAVLILALQCMAGRAGEGVLLTLRFLIFAESALLLFTSPLRDYLLALVQWKVPYELAFMVVLAFRFLPLLRREALDVYYSMQLRGLELKKASLAKRFQAYGTMCGPILGSAMERARDMAVAMEARGFRSSGQRTYMRKLKLQKKDIAVMVTVPLAAAGMAGLSWYMDKTNGIGYQSPGMEIVLSVKSADSLTVSWGDDVLYDGILKWDGQELAARAVCIREGEYYRYAADVPKLEEGKKYIYTVGSQKKRSASGTYICPGQEDAFSFFYMGDIQYSLRERDYEAWGSMLADMYRKNPHMQLGIFGGDMVENGSDRKDWRAFLHNGESVFSRLPVITAPGNHETSVYPGTYLDMMELPDDSPLKEECYSLTYRDCCFLVLNSCLFMEERMDEKGYGGMMKKVNRWIGRVLQESEEPWKIVVMHHPMYPAVEDDEIYQRIRDSWEPLFVQGGVNLILCGHQHIYMRTKPIHGITAVMENSGKKRSYYLEGKTSPADYAAVYREGVPGYVRVEVSASVMDMTAYSEQGEKIDHYQWEK